MYLITYKLKRPPEYFIFKLIPGSLIDKKKKIFFELITDLETWKTMSIFPKSNAKIFAFEL